MCGIAGKVTSEEPVDRDLIAAMCGLLRHRGPDDEGIHAEGPVGLGMRRLSIIDLATGSQPLYSEDGRVVLVFNGEIYNYQALRERLLAAGHRFRGLSDGEVIVHLWEDLGPDCVQQLRGMFAFAIWDAGDRRLFLARDRVGKKPLFYSLHGGALRFASEPRAIFVDGEVPRTVAPAALDAFLVNQYVPHDLCAFRHLRKLPPASTLSWRPGGDPKIERYWRLDYSGKEALSAEGAAERLRELILEATRLRLMSDVPIGAFLSGGLDSSAVVAAMAMASPEPVRTFSVAFRGWSLDETHYARLVAERYATDHHELEVDAVDASLLPRLAWHFGEPFADPAALPTYQLAELTRNHVTVALNGDGGDESFAGYDRYWKFLAMRPADLLPRRARAGPAHVLEALAGGTDGRRALPRAARLAARFALPPADRYSAMFRSFTERDRARLYTQDFRAELGACDPLAHIRRAWDAGAAARGVDRVMDVDVETYLPDDLLAKVDVASMAQSLELRSPLLDHELMEFAAALAPRLKLTGRSGKAVFRNAVRDWLPGPILDRPKQGFAVPVARWLREELRQIPEDVLLDPVARDRRIFDANEVEGLIQEHRAGADRSWQLWAMINLELWFQTCVDRAPAAAADVPALA